jgi:hypothetical protein
MSDPKNIGRPAVFGRPSDRKKIVRPAVFVRPVQATGTGGFLWPHSFTDPVSQNLAHPNLKFPPTGLLPLESPPPQDLRLLRPKNSRLFFQQAVIGYSAGADCARATGGNAKACSRSA